LEGSVVCVVAATISATISFLIARYLVRDKLHKLTENNRKFRAIDLRLAQDSLRVVMLLRLTPPLPLANYLYGLTRCHPHLPPPPGQSCTRPRTWARHLEHYTSATPHCSASLRHLLCSSVVTHCSLNIGE
jgi:hypothetical protein